jgi:hypothetical protein
MEDANKKEIPFSGKWITAEPASIGMNFRTLTNMRYTDTHAKSVLGMTKINVADLINAVYLKVRNAFHFKKSQPSESHILMQAYNAALTAAAVFQNTATIPNTGSCASAALWTDSAGFGLGRFSDAPDGQVIYCNGVDACIWGGAEMKVGALITTNTALSAAADIPVSPMDYSDYANNTKMSESFTVGGSTKSFLIGSPRPAQGAKLYIKTANTTANTLVVSESSATNFNALTVTADGTRVGGTTSFGHTGLISWASAVATTKPRYFEGVNAYWYQFTIDNGSAEIYHITLDLPFQPIIDTWDGIYRDITRFFKFTTVPTDNTTNVLKEDFEATETSTYCDLASFGTFGGTANYLIVQFGEKVTGLQIGIPVGYANATASAVMSVDYWDGANYQNIASAVDGTNDGATSFAKTGVVYWNNSAVTGEQKRSYNNGPTLYTYRLHFDKTLSASCRVEYIAGITANKEINYYKFPVFAQGRVLLCCDMSGEKNKAICSSKYMPQVYNGEDSVDVYFGEEGELTCGTELFSQYGSSLYSLVLMFKNNESWVMAGQDIAQWADNTFLLSSSIGCADPLTLKTINLHAEPGAGVNRSLAIWRGPNGVYMSDGRAPIPIHGDIKEYFDPESAIYIPSDGTAVAFIDPVHQEYHLILNATTEVVYDIARNKWFSIDRVSHLRCGVTVHDTAGKAYTYGFLDTGYMERLENGTTFDGEDIAWITHFGDMPLAGLDKESLLETVTLFTVAKANDITCTHYLDTSSTGTAKTMDHTDTNRLATPFFDEKLNGYFHSLKYTGIGPFEPLATVIWFHPL